MPNDSSILMADNVTDKVNKVFFNQSTSLFDVGRHLLLIPVNCIYENPEMIQCVVLIKIFYRKWQRHNVDSPGP